MNQKRFNDSALWYMDELTSRIIAKSGKPKDRFHIGKIILQSFKDAPDLVSQIDGATNQSETSGSVLTRSVKCATAFRNIGLQQGDVMVMMAPNHIDVAIPLYAALYLGIVVAPIDRNLTVKELNGIFSIEKPKIIFCQSEKKPDIQMALTELDTDVISRIITFDDESSSCNFSKFLDAFADDTTVQDFKPSDFDPKDTTAILLSTSGTTGLPKTAVISHKNLSFSVRPIFLQYTKFPTPVRMLLSMAQVSWFSGIMSYITTPIFQVTRLQTSLNLTQRHVSDLFNTYKPSYMVGSPVLIIFLLKCVDSVQCDLSCLEDIIIGGSAVPPSLITEIKKITPNTEVSKIYATTEFGPAFLSDDVPLEACGKPLGCFFYRLIDTETQQDITTPNVPGELWLKGPSIMKGYYNNPTATKEVFTEDGWFKTGDLFYRDESWNYYFVERIKLLLKCNGTKIAPSQLEGVIRRHPGVLEVVVTGIYDPAYGDMPVACVVRRQSHADSVTSQDIKNLVKDALPATKQLVGGVIFLDQIPMTPSNKVHRKKLKEMVLQMERE